MEKLELCEITCIDDERVQKVKTEMLNEERFYELADLFKVFSDSTRIKILWALSLGELCVCDIATSLGMSQSAISHQLRLLKQAKLVKYKKVGKVVYYDLDDSHVHDIFAQGLAHVDHTRFGGMNDETV